MEEFDIPIQEILKPYQERINKLTESISQKDTEILTLQYALIGLQTTLSALEKVTPLQTKKAAIKLKPLPIKESKVTPLPKKLPTPKPKSPTKTKAITHRDPKKKPEKSDITQDDSTPSNRIETEIVEESKDLMDMEIFKIQMTSSVKLPSKPEKSDLAIPSLKKTNSAYSPSKLRSKTPSQDSSKSLESSPSAALSPEKQFMYQKTKSSKLMRSPGSRGSMNLDDSFIRDLGSFIQNDEPEVVLKITNFKTINTFTKMSNIQYPKFVRVIDEYDIYSLFHGKIGRFLRNLKKCKFVHSFIINKNHIMDNNRINEVLYKLKNKLRSVIITEKEEFDDGSPTKLSIHKSSISRLDKLVLTERVKVNMKFAMSLKSLVLNYNNEDDKLLKTLIRKISLFKRLKTLRFNFKNADVFKDLENLNKNIIYRTIPPALGITVIPDENNREVMDQMHSLDWAALQYFKVTINAMMPQVYFLDNYLLSKLRQLKIRLEVGAKLENLNSLDNFSSLESLSITTKLNLKSYQVFLKLCSFPKQVTELEIVLLNFPAKELLDNSKDFNPHLVKKYDNHEIFGLFARRVERMTDVRKYTLSLQTAKPFETWNSYILTTLLLHKDKVKYLEINVNHVAASGEPFDLEELCNRITIFKPHLKSLKLFSYIFSFSQVKSVKNLQSLHSLCLNAYAKEFYCQFRICNIFEILNADSLTHFELPITLFMDIYIPLFEKICICRHLKSLKVDLDGEGLTENQFRDIMDRILDLYKLESLEVSLKPFIGNKKLFEETARKIEARLPYLTHLDFQSNSHLKLDGPRSVKVHSFEIEDDGVL